MLLFLRSSRSNYLFLKILLPSNSLAPLFLSFPTPPVLFSGCVCMWIGVNIYDDSIECSLLFAPFRPAFFLTMERRFCAFGCCCHSYVMICARTKNSYLWKVFKTYIEPLHYVPLEQGCPNFSERCVIFQISLQSRHVDFYERNPAEKLSFFEKKVNNNTKR